MAFVTLPASRLQFLSRVPVPLPFLLCYLAGDFVQRLCPLPSMYLLVAAVIHTLGLFLLLCGLLLFLCCAALFVRARNSPLPQAETKALVTGGPYRLTRNPMYLSLVLTYLGVCAVWFQFGALLLLPLPVLLLTRVVVPFEEARLRARFGSVYRDYCARVRRWI